MSLILDALRKADADRERGAVPGLHAQPVPPVSVETPARPPARPLLWTVLGAALGLVVAIAVYVGMRDGPAPATDSAAAVPASPPVAPTATAPMTAAAPAGAIGAVPAAEPAPWPQSDSRKAAERAPAGEAASARRIEAADEPPVATAPAAAPVVAREQLPDNIRAQLPALTFGGSIYSSNPANRTLIINGRLQRENDEVMPGLTLEQIKPAGAVLNYKGYRFEVQL